MSTFIKILKPIVSILPTINEPTRKTSFKEKLMWTGITLLVFLVCSNIPLLGQTRDDKNDPLHFMRLVTASQKGTLMDLGISPIVTASMVIQLLQGLKIINIDMSNDEEKEIYENSQKFFGLIMTLLQAIGFSMAGMYGDISFFSTLLIIVQLFVAGMMILLLDELLTKGYGFGSAISLFIAVNVCENIIWSAFSPFSFPIDNVNQFEGSILNFFHVIFARPDKLTGLYEAFFRDSLPNLSGLISTLIVFLTVMYFQGFKVEIPLSSKSIKIDTQTYSIKLFYTSNMPIILYSSMTSMIFMISQVIFRKFPTNVIVNIFGSWSQSMNGNSRVRPLGGLCYYLSTPHSLSDMIQNPIHSVISIALTCIVCSFLSREWIKVSGASSQDVKKQLQEQRVSIKGFRDGDSSVHLLDRYIPIAASFGGLCIALLSVGADLLGAVGSGTGILLAATTISDYMGTFQREYKKEMGAEFPF